MRGTLIIIVTAVLGFFGYQYAVHGVPPSEVFEAPEPFVCPGDVAVGSVVEHITGNFKGWVTDCNRWGFTVDLGNSVITWEFAEVKETQR